MRHFHQILSGLDVVPLLYQLNQHPWLWGAQTEWNNKSPGRKLATYNTQNIVLRYNSPGGVDWNRPALNVLTAVRAMINDVMRAIPGERLGKIVITRMAPGEKIDRHIDHMPPGVPIYWQRYQVPLRVKPGVRFVVGDEEMYLEPGTAWWFDNQVSHAVFNDSNEDRISMLTDIIPASSATSLVDPGRE